MSTISTMALVPQLPGMALTTRTEVLMDTFVTIGVVREGGRTTRRSRGRSTGSAVSRRRVVASTAIAKCCDCSIVSANRRR